MQRQLDVPFLEAEMAAHQLIELNDITCCFEWLQRRMIPTTDWQVRPSAAQAKALMVIDRVSRQELME